MYLFLGMNRGLGGVFARVRCALDFLGAEKRGRFDRHTSVGQWSCSPC